MINNQLQKTVQVINYFATQAGGAIDKLKLMKLIFLADHYHLMRYARPITEDHYVAMKYGPVPSYAKDIAELSTTFLDSDEMKYVTSYIQNQNGNKIISVADTDKNLLSETDEEILDLIQNEFGNKTSSQLVDITHKFPEWQKFESNLENGLRKTFDMRYIDFFSGPQLIIPGLSVTDNVMDLSKAIYQENQQFVGNL